ncbi:MAG TPA: APC family permease [Ktedonobacteraceae bacterium]|nr:APC family permease [Ktedonobacteraceae bacterium]
MVDKPSSQEGVGKAKGQEAEHAKGRLGPLLCWAVVFADIGTSVYYVPGILYGNVGSLAGFFVFLTLSVFVLLTLKYAEVTQRFPQGGGVVTVAAKAMNHWVGALGGMFILVDYFLTSALSCLSGIFYFSVVVPTIGPFVLWITIGILVVLGILNWVGISESAKVSMVGAVVAFVSDLAVLFTVFTHISFNEFLLLFPRMFAQHALSPLILLTGFGGSFLAFSGLESISQLSPVMKTPRKKVAGIALLLVVITVAVTSPFLTMFTTLLLPAEAKDPVLSTQLVSLLAGHWGNRILQTEMAISASALLVFASNTAIIGSYHVFMALSRMSFFPAFILQRNRLRGTPHYSIALATGIPIAILLLANGSLDLLGNMYAFGLLGAFSLTCLGIDIVRYRERKAARWQASQNAENPASPPADVPANTSGTARTLLDDPLETTGRQSAANASDDSESGTYTSSKGHLWKTIDFWLGILTTVLVVVAWSTNLVAKPLATAFGGSVATVGMAIAYFNYGRHKRHGLSHVGITHVEHRLPGSILAVLIQDDKHNETVVRVAIHNAARKPVVFLYISKIRPSTAAPRMFEFADPYLHDEQAKETFARVEHLAQKQKIVRRYVYRLQTPDVVKSVWSVVHPKDVIADAERMEMFEDMNPDFVRYELTPDGKVVHLVKNW